MKKSYLVLASTLFIMGMSSCIGKKSSGKILELKGNNDSVSYAMGVYYADMIKNSLKQYPEEINQSIFLASLSNSIKGMPTSIQATEARELIEKSYTESLERLKAKNLQDGKDFIKNYESKGAGEVKHTESGIYYKVLREGDSSIKPMVQDTVVVHYEGRNIKGEIFDSSYKRGNPITLSVLDVIPGWTEGLCLMRKGAKYEFVIPASLAYGERTMSDKIPANSTLVFDIELLDVKPYIEKADSLDNQIQVIDSTVVKKEILKPQKKIY